jgi:hypothetical protein
MVTTSALRHGRRVTAPLLVSRVLVDQTTFLKEHLDVRT